MSPSLPEEEAVLFSAAQIPLPAEFINVVRWVSAGESMVWEHKPLVAPIRLREDGGWLPVAVPGTPKPDGTGPLRLEFAVPQVALASRSESGWLYLKPGSAVVNLHIFGPVSFLRHET